MADTAAPLTMDTIVSLCRRRGFVFPSSEIYGGIGSTYDYGHYGVLTKNNIRSLWLRSMVQERDDIVALDSAIILNPRVWEASGHVAGFTDPLVDCRTCKLRFRADRLEDASCGKQAEQAARRDAPTATSPSRASSTSCSRRRSARSRTAARPPTSAPRLRRGSSSTSRTSPSSRAASRRSASRRSAARRSATRSRPATSSSACASSSRWRWSSSSRPTEADEWYRYWVDARRNWYLGLGLREENLRVREHDAEELSHYSSATSDLEYLYPIGWQELEGVANRGDYDLTQHTQASGTKLEWVEQDGTRYTPHVIEPAVSIDRIMLAFLCDAYHEEVVSDRERVVLRLHPLVAPVKAAILPLIAKDEGMATRARALYEELRRFHVVEHDESGQIGRRYRRQDEIGTPWAFTVDEQTLSDETVTVRDRDSLAQERLPIAGVRAWLDDALARDWRSPQSR